MVYPYNTIMGIMGKGSINKLETTIHGLYLCMKILGPHGAITVYGDQQTARNIESGFHPGQRNAHCLTTKRKGLSRPQSKKIEAIKTLIQSNGEAKKVPLNSMVPNQTILISEDLNQSEKAKVISSLNRNKDVFVWSALDLIGVSHTVIEHGLSIGPSIRPKK